MFLNKGVYLVLQEKGNGVPRHAVIEQKGVNDGGVCLNKDAADCLKRFVAVMQPQNIERRIGFTERHARHGVQIP